MAASPRISFSYNLPQADSVPIDERFFRSSSSSNNVDFDFCVLESFAIQNSSADELFFDGKILPIQIKKKMSHPEKIPQLVPPQPPFRSRDDHSIVESSKNEKLENHQTDDRQTSKSFWRFKRSSSLNCGIGYATTLCPLPLLSRSNSTGSSSNSKRSSSITKDNNHNHKQSAIKQSQCSSSCSYQKPPLKKSFGHHGSGIRVNPVLNVPTPNLFGLGSIFSNCKDKNKKK